MSKSKITLVNGSCADQEADVVVNAANGGLWAGGGICGVEFRCWANSVLKHYILKGYAVNDNRIKQLGEVIRIMKRTENERDALVHK